MRRNFFAAAVLALAATCPALGWAGDREIAGQIIERLQEQREAGTLKGFKLDLKVDQGVVLFKGKVSKPAQKEAVLAAAEGLEGITEVVDEINVESAGIVKPAPIRENTAGFDFRQALASEAAAPALPSLAMDGAASGMLEPMEAAEPMEANNPLASQVVPASANEQVGMADQQVTSSVISAIGQAQREGQLKGFGVDVTTAEGAVTLTGRTSSASHKDLIIDLARNTPGVTKVIDDIRVMNKPSLRPTQPQPMVRQAGSVAGPPRRMAPPSLQPARSVPQQPVAARMAQQYDGVSSGAMVDGGMMSAQPAPMAPYATGAATPRYDQPYLPNYAWPGYAAYPNYAALTYPQQYSPSAWPYIGPFYPYPQVPLGWRKVSLEWDDGWWFLDFTDRSGRH